MKLTEEQMAQVRDRGRFWRRGEEVPASKLTAAKVREIRHAYGPAHGDMRRRWRQGTATIVELARKYGVSKDTIHRVVRRKTWVHI